MKKSLVTFFVVVFLLITFGYASASVIIDPSAGWDGTFEWDDGLGAIDSISADSTQKDWSITVAGDSIMSFTSAWDAYITGDEFSFIVDNVTVDWTSTSTDGSGYFHGIYDNLFLSAGTHLLTFEVTALAPNYIDGAAFAKFSSTTPSRITPVPEPSTFLLLGGGLAGLAFAARRRKKE